MKTEQESKSVVRKILNVIVVLTIIMVVLGVALGPTTPPSLYTPAIRTASMQHARFIGICLSRYATDHQGHYPEGNTSTEVFQHLIDEKYVEDPNLFYEWTPAKVRPQTNQLKAENVGWDVTCCVDSSAPDGLPVVFLTGYKITYQAASRAEPVERLPRNWTQWWSGPDRTSVMKTYIAVCYKDTSARAIKADEDGCIPNFIPANFNPKGKSYRQLTP